MTETTLILLTFCIFFNALSILGVQALFDEGMVLGWLPGMVERRFNAVLSSRNRDIFDLEVKRGEKPHDEGLKEISEIENIRLNNWTDRYWDVDPVTGEFAFKAPWWTKPLWGCNVCMTSVWGLSGFAMACAVFAFPWVFVFPYIGSLLGLMVVYNAWER